MKNICHLLLVMALLCHCLISIGQITWVRQGERVVNTNPIGMAMFGEKVALSPDGSTALASTCDSIAAGFMVYRLNAGQWVKQAFLPHTGQAAVSANGNVVAISNLGGIVIYECQNNAWAKQATIQLTFYSCNNKANGTIAISYDGNTILYAGRIWVRNNNSWVKQAVLMPADLTTNPNTCDTSYRFYVHTTSALSADGNTAVVGNVYMPDSTTCAWVFTRNGSTWAQQGSRLPGERYSYVTYTNGPLPHYPICAAVAISGNGQTLCIGAKNRSTVYRRYGNVWSKETVAPLIMVTNTPIQDYSDNLNMVALSYDGNRCILAYKNKFRQFNRVNGAWSAAGTPYTFHAQTVSDSLDYALYSNTLPSVAIDSSGNNLFWGQGYYRNGQGAAFYFVFNAQQTWQQVGGYVYDASGNVEDYWLAREVALSADGSTMVQTSPYDDGYVGAAWVYKRNGLNWQQFNNKMTPNGPIKKSYWYGKSVSLSANGDIMAVGAPYTGPTGPNHFMYGDGFRQGCIFMYKLMNNNYQQMGDSLVYSTGFGVGTKVVLSADGNTLVASLADSGLVVYRQVNNAWVFNGLLYLHNLTVPPPPIPAAITISADGNTIGVVDVPQGDTSNVCIFRYNGLQWIKEASNLYPANISLANGEIEDVSLSDNGNRLFLYTIKGLYVTNRVGPGNWTLLQTIQEYATQSLWSLHSSASGDSALVRYGNNFLLFIDSSGQWIQKQVTLANGVFGVDEYLRVKEGYTSSLDLYCQLESTSGANIMYAFNVATYAPGNSATGLSIGTPVITKATCAGVANGKIVLSLTGGVLPLHFAWSNNAPDSSQVFNLLPGIYTVTVSDAAGDTIIESYTVGVVRKPAMINYSTAVNCNTGVGSINPVLTNTVGSLTYIWNTNPVQNNDTAYNLTSGVYQFTVTDSTGCVVSDSAVLQPTNIWAYATALPAVCGNPNGIATATIYGGIPPYTYSWSNGGSTATVTGLSVGAYSATVTDATGCSASARAEVTEVCYGSITGTMFFDRNNNCMHDAGEPYAKGFTIMAANSSYTLYGSTDSMGHYSIPAPDTGLYTVQAAHWQLCPYTLCSGSMYPANVLMLDTFGAVANFALLGKEIDLTVEVETQNPFPGSSFNYRVYYGNQKDSVLPSGVVTLVYGNYLTLNNTTPAFATHNPAMRTITWNVSNISFLNTYTQYVSTNFTVSLSTPMLSTLPMQASIDHVAEDCNPANNVLNSPVYVTGSLDPNYKTAYPEGILNTDDSTIVYTIHFQNTGIDSTHFIVITDTLSSYLDPASVRTVGAFHHPYVFIIKENGILTWTFDPYALPDSATDPINSQGYVSFEVSLKPGLPTGTVIPNTAHIYFDYNEAVVTNTVVNNIDLCLGLTSTENISANVCNGEVFDFYGQMLNTTGNYQKTLLNSKGCDSIIALSLSVLPVTAANIDTAIAQGSLYTLPDGSTTGAAGTYTDTLPTANGCDSIVTINLSVISGIGEPGTLVGFTLRPNPVSSYLLVGAPVALNSIVVYNTTGQQVLAVDKPQPQGAGYNYYIAVELLAVGTYVIEVKGNGAVMRKRWVKM